MTETEPGGDPGKEIPNGTRTSPGDDPEVETERKSKLDLILASEILHLLFVSLQFSDPMTAIPGNVPARPPPRLPRRDRPHPRPRRSPTNGTSLRRDLFPVTTVRLLPRCPRHPCKRSSPWTRTKSRGGSSWKCREGEKELNRQVNTSMLLLYENILYCG